MTTAGAFETSKDGVTLRPLVRASNAAVTLDATLAGDRTGDPRRLLVGLTKAPKPPILAARLSGTLDSAYPDGLKKEETKPDEAKADEKKPDEAKPDTAKADESKKDEAKAADNALRKSARPANVILVGDADMLMDRNWIQMHSLFGQQVAQAFANNGDFVVNAIEQMSGGAALSDLRGRGVSWRPFEQLRDVQFALRRDVDNLKNLVTALNVGVVPVTVGVIALAFGMRRSRRPLPKKRSDKTA
jgi:ABC-type uncharacterized transport system involved in gliding motility auxiliary subunit